MVHCLWRSTNTLINTGFLKIICSRVIKSANMSMDNIEVCRVMMPDDANMSGNVHGGTILKMIEEAGVIIATRHCNNGEYALLYSSHVCL